MTGQHTVPAPGWECASFQPSGLFAQPGDIPRPILEWHTYNGNFDSKARDLQQNISCSIFQVVWLCLKLCRNVRGKTGVRQCTSIISITTRGSDLQCSSCSVVKAPICCRIGCN